jgi:hypothetical protein
MVVLCLVIIQIILVGIEYAAELKGINMYLFEKNVYI